MTRTIHVIINPAAGQDEPVLNILNRAFHEAGVDWDVFVTKAAGDSARYARASVEAGATVVAAYGGDGTVREVASALVNTKVPMAIFPGGTGNVMAIELGIPSTLAEAIAIALQPSAGVVRELDVGVVGDHVFLLRASAGFEAEMVARAPTEMKNRLGPLAYAFAAVQALRDRQLSHYRLRLDGREVETQGMTAIVANVGSMGQTGLTLSPTIRPDDGLLDLIIVRGADVSSLLSAAAAVVGGAASSENENFQLYQAREIEIEADPPQIVQVDGEIVGATPLRARIIPAALRVIVPRLAEAPAANEATATAPGSA